MIAMRSGYIADLSVLVLAEVEARYTPRTKRNIPKSPRMERTVNLSHRLAHLCLPRANDLLINYLACEFYARRASRFISTNDHRTLSFRARHCYTIYTLHIADACDKNIK